MVKKTKAGGTNCFEVIAGKSIPAEGSAKVFALVRRFDTKPKRRLPRSFNRKGFSRYNACHFYPMVATRCGNCPLSCIRSPNTS